MHLAQCLWRCVSQLKHRLKRDMPHLHKQRTKGSRCVFLPDIHFIQSLPSMSDCNWLQQAITPREKGGKGGTEKNRFLERKKKIQVRSDRGNLISKMLPLATRWLFIWLILKMANPLFNG